MVERDAPDRGARAAARRATSRGSSTRSCRASTHDCGGAQEIVTIGCSLGAFHAANFALKRADLFPLAICLSGNYDPAAWHGWGERGEAIYFNNPMDYVAHLHGDHLDWLRAQREPAARVRAGPVGGHDRGRSTAPCGSPALLGEKGIRHELDLWGHDVPHDWPSWRAQIAHHLPALLLTGGSDATRRT